MARTARSPFLGSLAIHAVALLALVLLRQGDDPSQATDSAPRTSARLVFLNAPGAGGGGGGGGERKPEPARRAEARGVDRMNVPVAPPATVSLEPAPPADPVDAPVLAAQPMAAAAELSRGLLNPDAPRVGSLGSGTEPGAGTGTGRGAGPGDGDGLDRGSNRGFGGDVYRPGNGVSDPILVRQVRPKYTSAAMAARLSGAVLVECIVDVDGTVRDARVVRSLDRRYGLDEEAVRAAEQWRFRPAIRQGQPVAVRITIELSFSIY